MRRGARRPDLRGPTTVYLTCAAVFVAASVLVSLLPRDTRPRVRKPVNLTNLLGGFSYVRHHPILLGAISLDLFVVMLGGVTALLPIYARDVLQTGPWGLGLLRSAPAVGALAMSVVLAHASIERRAGVLMFATTAVFGASILVFALSTSLVLSIAMLTIYGATDAVSVVIRMAMVQTRTPHDVLGRVMAVNSMCTGTSGTLGEFRAGVVAAAFGAVVSVVLGGLGALVFVAVWMCLFPELARIRRGAGQRRDRWVERSETRQLPRKWPTRPMNSPLNHPTGHAAILRHVARGIEQRLVAARPADERQSGRTAGDCRAEC